jgi:hypothetical protein
VDYFCFLERNYFILQWKILISPHVSLSPSLKAKKKIGKHVPNFFNANFSKIYTRKSSINISRTFFRWKRNFDGWDENYSWEWNILSPCDSQLFVVWAEYLYAQMYRGVLFAPPILMIRQLWELIVIFSSKSIYLFILREKKLKLLNLYFKIIITDTIYNFSSVINLFINLTQLTKNRNY